MAVQDEPPKAGATVRKATALTPLPKHAKTPRPADAPGGMTSLKKGGSGRDLAGGLGSIKVASLSSGVGGPTHQGGRQRRKRLCPLPPLHISGSKGGKRVASAEAAKKGDPSGAAGAAGGVEPVPAAPGGDAAWGADVEDHAGELGDGLTPLGGLAQAKVGKATVPEELQIGIHHARHPSLVDKKDGKLKKAPPPMLTTGSKSLLLDPPDVSKKDGSFKGQPGQPKHANSAPKIMKI
mmetsp:Transcript_38200/g.89213  ORF Transcript_38200/g.89213 Transcript_38200/m.89213 type:complete len:237 (-) Transcript_38200:261-971(-)|eukprot:CAMPEP_0114135130 /NCGR_PEP_ID=MMETSP0043_2-20121206/14539_1 /TAXON_ID=464988 /ORGANISM="Hemiselmis andersenii, Strain CCMP644" /LENGTH=236 /DNA_ID=CAMNT_0001228841 /DNA_START=69 /DNA_END=779 /DNA_ORIENTATION=-